MKQDVNPAGRPAYRSLTTGDPAPWFRQASTTHPRFAFSSLGGRYFLLGFLGTAADEAAQASLRAIMERRDLFDDERLCFFGISIDPDDQVLERLREYLPGQRYFWDFDGAVSRLYGALPVDEPVNGPVKDGMSGYRRFWLVLDPTLRILKVLAFAPDPVSLAALFRYLESLPPPALSSGIEVMAPVLYLPNVFEPELCRRLIDLYEQEGGQESGIMRDIDGTTSLLLDARYKRRRDHTLTDKLAIQHVQNRIMRRVNPEIQKAYSFTPTRMERYIVGCYTAEDGAHFFPHRDNTTRGTEHRKFAVSINLNADFDGGELGFPEYGPRRFKAPPGGAIVFGCGLLHTVDRVTRGRRYAFLPFLYDEEAARLREANNAHLDASVGAYRREARPEAG